MAEASDFKFGAQLGFAKAHHKIIPIGKSGCCVVLGYASWGSSIIILQRLKLATSILTCRWGLLRPTIKPHQEETVGVALG